MSRRPAALVAAFPVRRFLHRLGRVESRRRDRWYGTRRHGPIPHLPGLHAAGDPNLRDQEAIGVTVIAFAPLPSLAGGVFSSGE